MNNDSKKKPLLFSDLYQGMKVRDTDDIGVVINCEDPHNVYVKYDNDSGAGLYCFVEDCELYTGNKLYAR
jgi:hypothetical protein